MSFPEPTSWNGGPDDYPFLRINRIEREYGHGRCRRCCNPIIIPIEIKGFGAVCSVVCERLVLEARETKEIA